MKKFFKTILLIAGILFVINGVFDFGVTRMLNRSKCHLYRTWNCIIHDIIDADLLVMGSSRALRHYDTRMMDSLLFVNTYNLGLNASHVERQIVNYQVYCHYHKKPLFLIINFDYWTMWENGLVDREQYFPYLANPYMRRLIKAQEHFSIGELYIPMYRYYEQGVFSVMEAENDTIWWNNGLWYKGYWACTSDWNGKKLATIKTVKFCPNQTVVDKFDSFMSELQNDDVKVIFVSSPIYSEATKRTENIAEFYDFRNRFSEKYNVPVLDYINDPICDDTTYFYNATHLNKKGSELFTAKLCHDLDSLGLLNK